MPNASKAYQVPRHFSPRKEAGWQPGPTVIAQTFSIRKSRISILSHCQFSYSGVMTEGMGCDLGVAGYYWVFLLDKLCQSSLLGFISAYCFCHSQSCQLKTRIKKCFQAHRVKMFVWRIWDMSRVCLNRRDALCCEANQRRAQTLFRFDRDDWL